MGVADWEREFHARVAEQLARPPPDTVEGWQQDLLLQQWKLQHPNVTESQAIQLRQSGLLTVYQGIFGSEFHIVEGWTLEEALRAIRVARSLSL